VDESGGQSVFSLLKNLSLQQQPFQGQDSVAVGNEARLEIENTGSSFLNSSNSSFYLKDILHCPSAATNLLSIQKFCKDNNCHFILTSSHYFVKDNQTRAIILEGKSENGLYPLRLKSSSSTHKFPFIAFLGLRTSLDVWHFRLGHPSLVTVPRVIKAHSLPISNVVSNKTFFCDSCQLGKSKQLPFNASSRVSTAALDLIHSDLWTSPIPSMSGFKYYVIFVDDYSRYTWFYPLQNKSDVYSCFVKFKVLVENQFSCQIRQLQTDGGGDQI